MKNNEKLYKIITAVLWVIFIISIGYILVYYLLETFDELSMNKLNEEKSIEENVLDLDSSLENIIKDFNNNELSENIQNEVINVNENVNKEILVIKKLQEEYLNLIGWIKIDGTNIDYPIMQTDNNDYYLKRNYKGEYNMNGSIYLDYRVDFEDNNFNKIIYGHNNQNNKMFENLLEYESEEFFNQNKYVTITTDKEVATYEIFSVFKSKVYDKTEEDIFKYYNVIDLSTEELFNEYINNCIESSLYETNIRPEFGDSIITLSTCEYSVKEGRFVVVLRKVK